MYFAVRLLVWQSWVLCRVCLYVDFCWLLAFFHVLMVVCMCVLLCFVRIIVQSIIRIGTAGSTAGRTSSGGGWGREEGGREGGGCPGRRRANARAAHRAMMAGKNRNTDDLASVYHGKLHSGLTSCFRRLAVPDTVCRVPVPTSSSVLQKYMVSVYCAIHSRFCKSITSVYSTINTFFSRRHNGGRSGGVL